MGAPLKFDFFPSAMAAIAFIIAARPSSAAVVFFLLELDRDGESFLDFLCERSEERERERDLDLRERLRSRERERERDRFDFFDLSGIP